MVAVSSPPQIKIPKEFQKDSETRKFFENLSFWLFLLWQRTGGGDDFIDGSAQEIAGIAGTINRVNTILVQAQQKIDDLEQLSASNVPSNISQLKDRIDDAEQLIASINLAKPIQKRTGWDATTGIELRTNFGDTSLSDTSQALRALIIDLKALGLIGA